MNLEPGTLPLASFFRRLHQSGFHLGMDDYFLLIGALRGGFGLESKEALLFLCKKLWLKSRDREERFEQLFEEEYREEINFILRNQEKKQTSDSENTKEEDQKTKQDKTGSETEEKAPTPDRREEKESVIETVEEETITLSVEEVAATGVAEYHREKRSSIAGHSFIFRGNYHFQNTNQLKRSWRFLRKNEYEGVTDRLDIDRTIDGIVRDGVLNKFAFLPARRNKAELITLMDHGGSMAAFGQLARTLAGTASQGGLIANKIYYFYNIPRQQLFLNPGHTRSETWDDILEKLKKRGSAVLVISDAGAARGRFSPNRIEATRTLLDQLKKCTHRIAWLNPMPEHRWKKTSAEPINRWVPMFEATEMGLWNAVNVLRGKSKPEKLMLSTVKRAGDSGPQGNE